MNVIITMSAEQVRLVKDGYMRILVRSWFPYLLNPEKDFIFVIERSTARIALILQVGQLIDRIDKNMLWQKYHALLGISRMTLFKYQIYKQEVCAWILKKVWSIDRPVLYTRINDVFSMPRTSYYTKVCPFILCKELNLPFSVCWEANLPPKNAVQ